MNLEGLSEVRLSQRRELGEVVFGLETRNKYEVQDGDGRAIGFAAEQGKGFFGFLLRSWLGHWRVFDILLFDLQRQVVARAHHPFRFFFQRLEVYDATGAFVGALQQRWAFFTKRFDVEDANGNVLLEMRSGFFRIWAFPFFRGGLEVAKVEKRWGGAVRELFTDADTFRVAFGQAGLSAKERLLLVAAGLFIDLQYFERQAGS